MSAMLQFLVLLLNIGSTSSTYSTKVNDDHSHKNQFRSQVNLSLLVDQLCLSTPGRKK